MDSRPEVRAVAGTPGLVERIPMRTTRRLLPVVLLTGLVGSYVAAAEDQPPKAEEVLDKFVEATGGKATYEKIHSEKFSGTFEFAGKGIKGAITSYRAEPNNTYTSVELEGIGTIEEGTSGEVAWTRSGLQGPRIKEGDERAASMRQATLRAPLEWRKLYKQAETTGVENVEDQACYKVVLTPNEGKPETHFYDKKTNLLVKVTLTVNTPMGEIPTETLLRDYTEQDGLRSPHKIEQKAMGQEFVISIDKLEYNIDIPKDRFALPADIQALLPK